MQAEPVYLFTVCRPDAVVPIAVCQHAEDAATLAALYGAGARIVYQTQIVWTEGAETFWAAEKPHAVREAIGQRIGRKLEPAPHSHLWKGRKLEDV